jgi:putative transposase
MSQRPITFAEGESYHIYNRGTDKRTIFLDKADYKRFIELLYLSNSSQSFVVRNIYRSHNNIFEYEKGDPVVAIGAYCLMPNHFHILVNQLVDGGVTKFVNKLCTGYSMYFNKKYKRSGALFQGKFKAEHADIDEYLKYLYAYIHLNPVKLIDSKWKEEGIKDAVKAFDFAASFQYSSLSDYLGQKRDENKILDSKPFPEYFLTPNDIKNEVFEWLTLNEMAK